MMKRTLLTSTFLLILSLGFAQGYLRVKNTDIVNDNGPFLIRSIGTGNWMIQEGYMLQSTSAGINTHTQFRNKLEEVMGEEKTTEYYNHWLSNHFTKTDLDSMKAWGFNALRPALHYKWFTLPIEDEPVKGKNTWLDMGFELLDSLLLWAKKNEMYIILDMHGVPGGQGKNADISDYDHSKPSVWEGTENKDKLVALWVKLAERYHDNPWFGGYDFINEPNWNLDNNGSDNGCGCKNNDALWDLHLRLTKAVREIDDKHIIYLSGNCWGNNYGSFENHALKSYDKNTVITFHKYWNENSQQSIQQFIDMRTKYNRPLWMSEAGENSNQWFADAIRLFENNNIGWSWWPVKKSRLNNIFKVTTPDSYKQLIESWKKGNEPLSAEETFNAVMDYSNAHKTANCTVAPDVIFAMLNNSDSAVTAPFKKHTVNEWIYFADYDFGSEGYAYHDMLSENVHKDGHSFRKWNTGNAYRNDGVDIGLHNKKPYVGWIEANEWLQFTLNIKAEGAYKFEIQSATESKNSKVQIIINENIKTDIIELPSTANYFDWTTSSSNKIDLNKGNSKIRFKFISGGSNVYRIKITSL